HPLRVCKSRAELASQSREGNVNNRSIQNDHENAEHDRDQHFPFLFQPSRFITSIFNTHKYEYLSTEPRILQFALKRDYLSSPETKIRLPNSRKSYFQETN